MLVEAQRVEHIEAEMKKDQVEELIRHGWEIISLDGKLVIGFCESCERQIYEDDKYHEWEDGIKTCEECGGPNEEDRIDASNNI